MEHMSASMALASVTASTVSSTASSSASAKSAASSARKAPSQNWRGKYLRALNISTPEVDVTRKYAALAGSSSAITSSSSSATTLQQQQQQLMRRARSCRAMNVSRDAGESALRGVRSRRQLLLARQNSADYGFAVKPGLARGRRCHTDPVVGDEKVSAPIQIPSAAPASSTSSATITAKLSDITNLDRSTTSGENNRRYAHRTHGENYSGNNQQGKLLSWEDPVAMMGTTVHKAGRMDGGLDIAFSQLQVNGCVDATAAATSSRKSENEFFCDEFVEDPEVDDEVERSDSDDSDDNDDEQIFEMEDFENENNNRNNNSSSRSSRINKSSGSRRQRTASVSLATVTSPSSRAAALPRFHSVRHMRCPPRDASELPESFVPPHKLVQRDVFSLGLRDKFKRRPAKI